MPTQGRGKSFLGLKNGIARANRTQERDLGTSQGLLFARGGPHERKTDRKPFHDDLADLKNGWERCRAFSSGKGKRALKALTTRESIKIEKYKHEEDKH